MATDDISSSELWRELRDVADERTSGARGPAVDPPRCRALAHPEPAEPARRFARGILPGLHALAAREPAERDGGEDRNDCLKSGSRVKMNF